MASSGSRIDKMLSTLKEAFDEFDKDKNGKICRKELRGLLEKVGLSPRDENIEHLLDLIDVDKSGDICFLEFSSAMMELEAKKRELTMMKLRGMFRQYDRNNDGFITRDELKAIAKPDVPEKEIDDLMARLDIDKDGKISFEEFIIGMSSSSK